jgi:hypothetical protein
MKRPRTFFCGSFSASNIYLSYLRISLCNVHKVPSLRTLNHLNEKGNPVGKQRTEGGERTSNLKPIPEDAKARNIEIHNSRLNIMLFIKYVANARSTVLPLSTTTPDSQHLLPPCSIPSHASSTTHQDWQITLTKDLVATIQSLLMPYFRTWGPDNEVTFEDSG